VSKPDSVRDTRQNKLVLVGFGVWGEVVLEAEFGFENGFEFEA
jgi:hypothetical protein